MVIRTYTAAEVHALAQVGDEPVSIECEFCGRIVEAMPTDDVITYAIQPETYLEPYHICCSEDCCEKLAAKEGISIEG